LDWPEAVVFDLDGTLIDSAADIGAALNEALANRGLSTFSLEQVKEMIGGGAVKLLERALRAQGLPLDGGGAMAVEPIVAEFLAIYSRSPVRETTLYPGARELLTRLRNSGLRMGLCTNKPQGVTELIIREMDLARYFACVVGGRENLPRKPHPGGLQAVIAALNAAPGRTLMVGDSAADVGAARAAGVPVAVVSHGYSKTPVGQLGADVVIGGLPDLPRAVNALNFAAGTD
jgi:phosphoglycolate phosphatase